MNFDGCFQAVWLDGSFYFSSNIIVFFISFLKFREGNMITGENLGYSGQVVLYLLLTLCCIYEFTPFTLAENR